MTRYCDGTRRAAATTAAARFQLSAASIADPAVGYGASGSSTAARVLELIEAEPDVAAAMTAAVVDEVAGDLVRPVASVGFDS
jgi:hypothetical protein